MSLKGFRRIIFGDKEIDQDDPKYAARRKREMAYGSKFAKKAKLDTAALTIHQFASKHRRIFFTCVFLAIGYMGFGVLHQFATSVILSPSSPAASLQQQHEHISERIDAVTKKKIQTSEMDTTRSFPVDSTHKKINNDCDAETN